MANVKVILRESIPSLGEAGAVVTVKPGHAHNYLIPQGKASLATEGNVREIEHQKRVVADRVARELKALGVEKSRPESLLLEVKANVGEEGAVRLRDGGADRRADRARASISTAADPARGADQGDREHSVPVRLHKDVVANLKVRVSAAE
jgi:large subunit ribosomal protein L9